ncbi:cell division protein FtsA [candidate division WOR-3 bacterium]|nr:cell division protein FtsA [candidate division WOR-3 bacterium]MCK4576140.1 cell division protein FtsA [candidate division WOR-3 bacterium]
MTKEDIITALDLGTTKISAIIAEVNEKDEVNVVGVGTTPSYGLRRGVVVNLDKTVAGIRQAVGEAELMAGVKVNNVVVGIAGDHIKSFNSRGVIAVSRTEEGISNEDIKRVIEQAKAVTIPMDRKIVHVLPQDYTVDDQTGIKEPVGMAGIRLEAEVHIVSAAVTAVSNIIKSIERANLSVRDIILQPYASSFAVLDEEEKELGVCLIDVGGGTTDFAIFFEGSIRHTSVVGLGGVNITNDIAIGLRTPRAQAEEIKKRYGVAIASLVDTNEMMEVPGVGGRKKREVSRQILGSIIEPRMEEIFSLVEREIKRSGFDDRLTAGIVLTGGTAKMEGIDQLAERIFDLPVKIGIPKGIVGLTDAVSDPVHAGGIGLILYGYRHKEETGFFDKKAGFFDKIIKRIVNWFKSI